MAKVFFHCNRSNIGSFRLKNFSLYDWNAMVLHLVGKLNFFEFQEECLPIIRLNLDQVHAYSINYQSYLSRKQRFVRKNFILYFLFSFSRRITTFPSCTTSHITPCIFHRNICPSSRRMMQHGSFYFLSRRETSHECVDWSRLSLTRFRVEH